MEPAMAKDLAPAERAPIPLHPRDPDAGKIAPVSCSHLPHALTSFVGRGADVAAVQELLSSGMARWVTLTGPGGVGKTRLAVHLAHEMVSAFADGIVFVPLAPIRDPTLVLSAIARELGLRETGSQTVADLLVNHLRSRRLLLILDNVEQVADAAPLVAALLADCPGLTVLATCRTRLRVVGEYRFLVSPLALPDESMHIGDSPLAAIARSPAVQLFVERAQAAAPHFALDAANAHSVATICHRLDGLPLAIELAAVRLRIVTPTELLTRLEPALPLLTDGPIGVPDRLRTMRDAIAWSYDLLAPGEQDLLRRLSVFVGGCTLAVAEIVAGDEWNRAGVPCAEQQRAAVPAEKSSFLEVIAALIDASLVQRHDAGDETRLTMLETIREFALEHLVASGEQGAVAARHAAWCVQLAEDVRRSGALSRREGLAHLETEHPNLRVALGWLLAHGEPTRALHLAGELAEFWFRRGHIAEGIAWLERTLNADTGPPTAARATALVGLSLLHWPQIALPSSQEGETADEATDDFARSLQLLDEAEAVARAAGDAGALAYARLHQGYVAYWRGDLDLAEARGTEGMSTVAAIPQAFCLNAVHWLLAAAAQGRGDDRRAREHFTRLMELARAGDEISLVNALAGLALLAERRGELGVAMRGYAEAVVVCQGLGDQLNAWVRLEQAALAAMTIGHTAPAVRLLAAAETLREVKDLGPARLAARYRDHHEQALLTARSTLGAEAFAALWAAGSTLSLDEAIAEIHALADLLSRPNSDRRDALSDDVSARETRPTLTVREREVLALLADGLGDKAIAVTLGMSRRTASNHVAAILTKLGAETRTAAVTQALRQGLLSSSVSPDPSI
jgi:predicted ATPase/DNA-binding NarL/FixJ family response regulator